MCVYVCDRERERQRERERERETDRVCVCVVVCVWGITNSGEKVSLPGVYTWPYHVGKAPKFSLHYYLPYVKTIYSQRDSSQLQTSDNAREAENHTASLSLPPSLSFSLSLPPLSLSTFVLPFISRLWINTKQKKKYFQPTFCNQSLLSPYDDDDDDDVQIR